MDHRIVLLQEGVALGERAEVGKISAFAGYTGGDFDVDSAGGSTGMSSSNSAFSIGVVMKASEAVTVGLGLGKSKADASFGNEGGGEPFIVPLAIPLIAGPSALATVMLMASRDPGKVGMWAAAITVTMVITTVVLLAGTKLHKWLGEHAMHAIERLMGLILTAIAVEMLLAGIREFVKGL